MITFDTTSDIDEALDAELEEMQTSLPQTEEWVPHSVADADKLVLKISKLKELKERMKKIASAEMDDIQTCLDEKLHFYDAEIEGYERTLRVYFEGLDKSEIGETKTQYKHQLLHGSLILKKPKTTFKKDDAKLVEYFEQSGLSGFVKVEKKPAWGEFKKQLTVVDGNVIDTITGEVVPCVTASETVPEFEVK